MKALELNPPPPQVKLLMDFHATGLCYSICYSNLPPPLDFISTQSLILITAHRTEATSHMVARNHMVTHTVGCCSITECYNWAKWSAIVFSEES